MSPHLFFQPLSIAILGQSSSKVKCPGPPTRLGEDWACKGGGDVVEYARSGALGDGARAPPSVGFPAARPEMESP